MSSDHSVVISVSPCIPSIVNSLYYPKYNFSRNAFLCVQLVITCSSETSRQSQRCISLHLRSGVTRLGLAEYRAVLVVRRTWSAVEEDGGVVRYHKIASLSTVPIPSLGSSVWHKT